ncbi:MAG: FG-GAP-like repeat-containing protein [Candidatus Caldipriscus sp.]
MKRVILTALSIGLMPVLGYGQSFPPVNAAVGTWMMHHGSTSLRGLQLLKGAVTGPHVKCSYYFGSGSEGDPIIADINGDGLNEIVIPAWSNGGVWAFRGTNCSLLWSRSLGGSYSGAVTPAVGELNPSVPGLEIAVTHANTARLYVLRGTDGTILWNRYIGGTNPYYNNMSPPTIFDANGDGVGEVYVVGDYIYALRGTDGSTIWSYPASGGYVAVAIADINNDGQYEVVTVGYSGGSWRVIVLRATNGAFLWSYTIDSQGNPAIADLNNDGYKEIVVGTKNGMLYALRHNGTLYWSRNMGYGAGVWDMVSLNSPTIADLNGDGWKEIVYGHYQWSSGCASPYVHVLRGTNGTTIWSYSGPCSGYQAHSRKIADIDNDGQIEIILSGAGYGASPYLRVLNGATGAVEWTYSGLSLEGIAIGDVDNDGCMEIVATPDCCYATSFVVFDSPTPVSGCGILGDDEELKVEEDRNIGGVYLLVSPVKGGVNVETGRKAFVEIYTPDGRKVKGLEVDRSAFIELNKGAYIFRVKGHNLYRTVIVR